MKEQMKQRIITYFEEEIARPLSVTELEDALQLEDADEFKELVIALNELEDTGKLVRTRKNRFGLTEKMNLIRGRIAMHKKGFAFLIPDDESLDDIYIHHTDLMSAMNNDKVLVRREKGASLTHRSEGTVIRILERGLREIVGTYEDNGAFGFVIPDDKRIVHDIFIPKGASEGAISGHKVIVKLTKYPEGRMSAEGEVVKILGHKNDPG